MPLPEDYRNPAVSLLGFSLLDCLGEQVLNLAVDGAKIVSRPGCQLLIELCGKPERQLLLFLLVCHMFLFAARPAQTQAAPAIPSSVQKGLL